LQLVLESAMFSDKGSQDKDNPR